MPPISMLIKPASGLCNMRCKYCFYADVTKNREVKSYGIMSLNTLEALTKKALETAEGFCNFSFQGGEPTLVGIEFFEQLIELQKKYNTKNLKINNSIQTNGYAIDEKWGAFFANNNFLVGLSLDGYKEIHDSMRIDAQGNGTYSRILKTAAIFDKYNVEYNILCVVNNFVARHPVKVYNALKKFRYLQFIPCLDGFDGVKHEYSLDNERYGSFLKATFDCYFQDFMSGKYISIRNFDNYITILSGYPPESCGMNGFCTCYFVIEGDGGVFPCDFYVVDQYKLGNIHKDTFEEMQTCCRAKTFVEESKYVHENCRTCKWYGLCRGGCRRNREPFADDKPVLNIYCKAYKDFYEYAYERMMNMSRKMYRGYGANETL